MHIRTAQPEHLADIKQLYDEAITFQRQGGHPYWQNLDLSVVSKDIAMGHQYVLMEDTTIAGIFSLCPPSLLDKDLWQLAAPHSAYYLNRIIVARQFRGQQSLAGILAWCERELRRVNLHLLRLDTWAENDQLIQYYARFGFRLIGQRTSSSSPMLPEQYRGLRLALMERAVAEAGTLTPY